MEHYIEIIVMLAPGFIAKEVARALGNVKSRSSSIDQILNYFVYSIFCFFTTLLIYTIINKLLGIDSLQYFQLVFLAILSGVSVGYAWQSIVKKNVKRIIDKYTSANNGYMYFQEDSMLNNCMLDGKDHLIQIIKSGNVIATGKFLGATFSNEDTTEIKIDSHPVYASYLMKDIVSLLDTYILYLILKMISKLENMTIQMVSLKRDSQQIKLLLRSR